MNNYKTRCAGRQRRLAQGVLQEALVVPASFIDKWTQVQLSERSAAQQHFLDLCALVGHPPPAECDPTGESFTFERGAAKHGGGDGWADVWKRGCFGWEYKGKHKDLNAAYDQLLLYREALENPPLLVVCDLDRIRVHTNFTAVVNVTHEIALKDIGEPRSLEILQALFFEPEKLRPGRTSEAVTQEAAQTFAKLAASLRARGVTPDVAAHFLDRIVFCLFAEDIGLLPDDLFTGMVRTATSSPALFPEMAGQLFRAMANGGAFGREPIRHFNGSLFEDATAPELTREELKQILTVTALDWSAVDVSIFGTLFERGLDPAKRAQLGAHYTSRQDIELLVEPVVMQPLRNEWAAQRRIIELLLATGSKQPGKPSSAPRVLSPTALRKAKGEAELLLHEFLVHLQGVKVLDPACGSGNFLYVTLQKLKDLEKEVILFAMERRIGAFLPAVGPWQLYGIEVNEYAYDLALMTVWIGYLQWVKANGFGFPGDPVLHKLEGNFRRMDAILDLHDPAAPAEPDWPAVDFIVSNPPFLGNKRMRSELGAEYVEALWGFYAARLPAMSDLCCYWFEKARKQIADGKCQRAGLLATTGIRQVGSRRVLERIVDSAHLFFAISDQDWVLDGASVRISMVAFEPPDGESPTILDGKSVTAIHSDLRTGSDLTSISALRTNANLCFMGTTKVGAFDIDDATARRFLDGINIHSRPNSDVLRPFRNGSDLVRRNASRWIIDFGVDLPVTAAARYEAPFEYLVANVRPEREKNNDPWRRANWWQLGRNLPAFRRAVTGVTRYVGTPRVSKHRVFVWLDAVVLPDSKVIVIVRADDAFLGVLQSRIHEVWTRATCGWHGIGNDVTYNPNTCFQAFPFPWVPGQESEGDARVQEIAAAARDLCELRERWLNPPELTKAETLEFPATAGGPWDRFIVNPRLPAAAGALTMADAPAPDTTSWEFAATERNVEAARQRARTEKPLKPGEVGTARYPRLVPLDADSAAKLAKRTLTNLYNQRPEWLNQAHRRLDEAVSATYGWPVDLNDGALLARLLSLNLERANRQD